MVIANDIFGFDKNIKGYIIYKYYEIFQTVVNLYTSMHSCK